MPTERYGKWTPLVTGKERKELLEAIMQRIKAIARSKGLPDSYLQMGKFLQAQGVPVSRQYIYSQMREANNWPFPLEALIAICKGYGIPLSVIFNPELFADSPEL